MVKNPNNGYKRINKSVVNAGKHPVFWGFSRIGRSLCRRGPCMCRRTGSFPAPSGTLSPTAIVERSCGESGGRRRTDALPGHKAGWRDWAAHRLPRPSSSRPLRCIRGSSRRSAPCHGRRWNQVRYGQGRHPLSRLSLQVPGFPAAAGLRPGSRFRRRPAWAVSRVRASSFLSARTSGRLCRHGQPIHLQKALCLRRFPAFSASSASKAGQSAGRRVPGVPPVAESFRPRTSFRSPRTSIYGAYGSSRKFSGQPQGKVAISSQIWFGLPMIWHCLSSLFR